MPEKLHRWILCKRFQYRAGRAKRRWFSRLLKQGLQGKACTAEKQQKRSGMTAAGILLQIFLSAGILLLTYQALQNPTAEAVIRAEEELETEIRKECMKGQEDQWEPEILGVQVRFKNGTITFFREWKQVIREAGSIH